MLVIRVGTAPFSRKTLIGEGGLTDPMGRDANNFDLFGPEARIIALSTG
jgi:hypothetical protein